MAQRIHLGITVPTEVELHSQNVKKDALVLIMVSSLPPFCWKLGRITQVHPGSDNVLRVVSIQTPTGIIKRATSQVCMPPCNT